MPKRIKIKIKTKSDCDGASRVWIHLQMGSAGFTGCLALAAEIDISLDPTLQSTTH